MAKKTPKNHCRPSAGQPKVEKIIFL